MLHAAVEIHERATELGVSGAALSQALSVLVTAEERVSLLNTELIAQGGPNDINVPLQHELYVANQGVPYAELHARYHLGRLAARNAQRQMEHIVDVPSEALLFMSY